MEHKKIPVYLLLAAVITIWGIIIYRMSSNVDNGSNARHTTAVNGNKTAQVPNVQPDTFNLRANYPDPFAEPDSRANNNLKLPVKQVGAANPPLKKKMNVQIPTQPLRYVGFVRNVAGKKRIALISKEGKESFMEEGAFLNDLKLISVLKDSIKVSCNGKIAFIRREK